MGVGVLVGAVVAVRARPVTARVGANVVVNSTDGAGTSNSPTLLRNPQRRAELVVVNRVDRPPYSAQLHRSTDSGRTWTTVELPLPAGLVQPFGPDAAFGPDGTLYVAYVDLVPGANSPQHLWVTRSSDSGATLSAPVEVAGRYAFQVRLAVSEQGAVYLSWLQAPEVAVRALTTTSANPVVIARSDDGGRSFSTPVTVSDPHRPRVGAASPVLGPDGDVMVLYQDFKDDRRDFENLDGPTWESPFALVFTRSTDGGRTFSPGVEVESGVVPSRRFLVFLPEFPSMAAASNGVLYVVWSDGRNGDDDVFLRRSDDGGLRWTDPVRVNDNPVDGTGQRLARVATSGGRVDVVFLDGRRDPARIRADVFVASSFDRGRSFRNLRVTSASFDTTLGSKVLRSGEADFGTRFGLVSDPQGMSLVWTDSRLGNPNDQRQDIVFAGVAVEQGESRAVLWGLGSVLGALCLIAIGRFSAGFVLKRRAAATPVDL